MIETWKTKISVSSLEGSEVLVSVESLYNGRNRGISLPSGQGERQPKDGSTSVTALRCTSTGRPEGVEAAAAHTEHSISVRLVPPWYLGNHLAMYDT